MDYIYAVFALIGGLGALLIGFKLLSDNIEKLASSGLRKLFNKTTNNPLIGVGIGAGVTAVIQSSGATTVMIVGLTNAGILTLYQATALIMGANIGTTITAQIAALESFDIAKIAVAFAGIGMLMNMFTKKDRVKTIGLSLCGLGLVFLGLQKMSDSMKVFRESAMVTNLLSSVSNPLILILIGLIFTAIIQSSSAVTTIIIAMVSQGLIIGNGGNSVLYLIIGSNIGSCVTALLSSIGASTNAKRASIIHLMFNLFGSILFMIILLIWDTFMDNVLAKLFAHPATQIAMFHTIFNITNTIIFLPFIKVFVKISELVIKNGNDSRKTTYMDARLLKTPSVALSQLMKETAHLGDLAFSALSLSIDSFINKTTSKDELINQKINDVELLNKEIISYLVNLSNTEISLKEEKIVSVLHHSLSDFIRLGEIADNIVRYTHIEIKDNLQFSDSVSDSLIIMKEKLTNLFKKTKLTFLESDYSAINEIDKIEEEIDKLRTQLIDDHICRLEDGRCKPQNSGIYINLISNLERAGDHIHYVAHMIIEK